MIYSFNQKAKKKKNVKYSNQAIWKIFCEVEVTEKQTDILRQ